MLEAAVKVKHILIVLGLYLAFALYRDHVILGQVTQYLDYISQVGH